MRVLRTQLDQGDDLAVSLFPGSSFGMHSCSHLIPCRLIVEWLQHRTSRWFGWPELILSSLLAAANEHKAELNQGPKEVLLEEFLFLMCTRWKVIFLYCHITENPCKEQLSDLFRKVQDIWNIPVIVQWLFSPQNAPQKYIQRVCAGTDRQVRAKHEWNVMILTKKTWANNFFSLKYFIYCAWKRWSRTLRSSMAHQHKHMALLLLPGDGGGWKNVVGQGLESYWNIQWSLFGFVWKQLWLFDRAKQRIKRFPLIFQLLLTGNHQVKEIPMNKWCPAYVNISSP